ncbi:YgdB family protein [Xenorhabdus hominickii]|uniref:DUF2509 family protein n=1 Tax=Xenorhabdus hominickii TaxID=351679 RepID=A0A2G0QGF2_XENHO|nr:YgdB family protein [Xenorhabdus hominickii]AOM42296.1 hypothetical protein A9255_18065 [Xenorhabdus hominickii]PHM58302.1 hypothetical protein Xhom_01318 [Xenorhabdus hominickii]
MERQKENKQQGNILLISILMLLALSLMMLKALHYQRENAMLMMMDEQNYMHAFLRAESSSLTWGKVQAWQVNQQEMEGWLCLQQTEFHLKSCLKHYSGNHFLLKGVAQFTTGENLELYQWMEQMKYPNQDTLIPIKLIPVASGWLDFCPVPQAEFCL